MIDTTQLPKSEWWHLTEDDFVHLDIVTEIERYTSTRLHQHSGQFDGACPYNDCDKDDDGFIVWPDLSFKSTKSGRHYWCRGCGRAGNIVKLLQDIKGMEFDEACSLLEIGSPDAHKRPRKARAKSPQDLRNEKETAWLHLFAYRMQSAALNDPRALAYFEQRTAPLSKVEALGLMYLPALKDPAMVKAAHKESKDADLWDMRIWADRIIFPLPGGGFTGRTLFKWEPGMDEDTHKKIIDEFNEKVDAYNERAKAKYGKDAWWKYRKEPIPRWKTTSQGGYFHADVLQNSDHATFVEGPFDVVACEAAGITDSIATSTNNVNISAIPLRICDVTLAYDGDQAGIAACDKWAKEFRRKGITVTCVTPPDDGLGKDWSARYRRGGAEALTSVLIPAPLAPSREDLIRAMSPEMQSVLLTFSADDQDDFFAMSPEMQGQFIAEVESVEMLDEPLPTEPLPVDPLPASPSPPDPSRKFSFNEIISRILSECPGLAVSETVLMKESAAMKARVTEEYRLRALAEHAEHVEQSRPAYTRIVRDFTKQPDWIKHGYIKVDGKWREERRYREELAAAALAAKKKKKLGVVEVFPEYTRDPALRSYTHDDLVEMGLSMEDLLHQLDNENVASRALKDLDLPMFSAKKVEG